jgi:hypothetical protein
MSGDVNRILKALKPAYVSVQVPIMYALPARRHRRCQWGRAKVLQKQDTGSTGR